MIEGRDSVSDCVSDCIEKERTKGDEDFNAEQHSRHMSTISELSEALKFNPSKSGTLFRVRKKKTYEMLSLMSRAVVLCLIVKAKGCGA